MNIFGTFFLVVVLPLSVFGQSSIETVLRLAETKKINQERQWNKLLHIERNAIGIKATQVTEEHFFLSNLPEYENKSELEATLLGFAEPAQKFHRVIQHPLKKDPSIKITDHSQHPICRFPARLKYLKSALAEASDFWSALPQVECVYKDIFMKALSPKSLSYVFSSYYADSPGSAFGHTFFRVGREASVSKTKQELLDYGIGFAANVTVTNPAAYAILGLVGGFTGSWTNLPYYYKVREYNDYEARDLWSYDLNLTPDEIEMFTLHLWEVGGSTYTYYFFTQNCAYHMLTVLEAAAPRLHLIEHVPFYYVIPADSMKALFYEKDLVKGYDFRPSARKVFLERAQRLDEDTFEEFKDYAATEELPETLSQMSDESRALFLDAAIDLIDLRYPQLDAEKNKIVFQKKEKLLSERAQASFISPAVQIPVNNEDRPDKSHGSTRLSLSYSEKSDLKYGALEYRFALHDLQDPQTGLPKLSQLEFFNLKFKLLPRDLHFHEMNLFKVFNLSPINFFEKKASWGIELGIQNKENLCAAEDRDCYLAGALVKYGVAFDLGDLVSDSEVASVANPNPVLWALATVNGRYGATLLDSKYYLAPGFEVGLLHRFTEGVSFLGSYSREFPSQRAAQWDYHLEYRHAIQTKASLGLFNKNDFVGVTGYFYF